MTTLKSKYLEGLPEKARKEVFKVTAQLESPLREWMERYALMGARTVRVPHICLSIAAADPGYVDETYAGPDYTAAALQPCVRLVAWIFGVDDLTDEGKVAPKEVGDLARTLFRLKRDPKAGQPAPVGNEETSETARSLRELYQGLESIYEDVARGPGFSEFRTQWEASIEELIEGMQSEHDWSIQYGELLEARPTLERLPAFDAYVRNGSKSVGVRPIFLTALIMRGRKEALPHLDALLALEDQAAGCIRLANDLRTYKKEETEGKFNSVVLQKVKTTPALSTEDAVTEVKKRLKTDLEGLNALARKVGSSPSPGWAGLFLLQIAGFSCDFYAHHDYHHALTRVNG